MNNKDLEGDDEVIRRCRGLVDEGLSIDDLIRYLHDQDMTITESMKALIVICDISLRDAKSLVSAHPVWKDVVAASEPLQEEAELEICKLEKQQNG
jgi:hypothetical protein